MKLADFMRGVKLADFMAREGISPADFARRIGVGHISVNRYLAGTRVPAPDVMVKIAKATDGAVTPNDFLLPAPKDEAAE
jgi:transcriptional regulator with XRE-family HTH domain